MRALSKSESGQALTEMALVLPLFLLLIFGVIQFGMIGYDYLSVNNGARAGVRIASVGGDDSTVTTAVQQGAPGLSASQLSIQITPVYSQRQSGQNVTVTVSYPVPLIFPLVQGTFPNPLIVSANLTMRME